MATALGVLAQLYLAIPLAEPVGVAYRGDATFASSTVYGLCYSAGFLVWGPVADHYSGKRVLVGGLAALVVVTAAVPAAGSMTTLGVLRGLQGLVAASFAPVALAHLGGAVPPRHRATAIGAMSAAFPIAGLVGQIVAQAVSTLFGRRWVFTASAAGLACSAF